MVSRVQGVYSRKGGVDLFLHTFVMWAWDWRWIEQTLNSRWSPPETEVFIIIIMTKAFDCKVQRIGQEGNAHHHMGSFGLTPSMDF